MAEFNLAYMMIVCLLTLVILDDYISFRGKGNFVEFVLGLQVVD